ncbi:holocytochrome-c synthase [Monosporozyma unispora]|nr:holocytochrome c synthase [Kazachstania unispora]
MGWFWTSTANTTDRDEVASPRHDAEYNNDISMCPVMHNSSDDKEAHAQGLNPLNYLPRDLSPTKKQPGQKLDLTTNKTVSTIPRGSNEGKWEYPSAQQMYNAMLRKGKINQEETLQGDTVEAMVQIHNFLNESCWFEILRWEKPYTDVTHTEPKLLKFMGKPGILTPRARITHYLSYIFPSKFQRELPFDRHDWIVLRGNKDTKVRYVLDFYGGPDDSNGMPTFSVDVRPALDNLTNVKDRFNHFTSSILSKLSSEK